MPNFGVQNPLEELDKIEPRLFEGVIVSGAYGFYILDFGNLWRGFLVAIFG